MIIAILISWYLLGVIGGLIASKWDNPKEEPGITVFDLLASLTIGGVMGLVTFVYGIGYYHENSPNNFLKKRLF